MIRRLATLLLLATPVAAQEDQTQTDQTQTDHSQMDHAAMDHGDMDGAYGAYMGAMDRMMAVMSPSTGDPDADFALGMIPHHQAAIDMARALLDQGGDDPELRALAEGIIAAQQAEIDQMRAWLSANGYVDQLGVLDVKMQDVAQ